MSLAMGRNLAVAALLLGAAGGCDAIIGLGAEPTETATSTGVGASGSSTGATGTTSPSVTSSSGGGDGGAGASTVDASAASAGGGGAGGDGASGPGGGLPAYATCGHCDTNEDCRLGADDDAPASCDDQLHVCRVRSIDVVGSPLNVDSSRGLAVLGNLVAFIGYQDVPDPDPDIFSLHVVDIEDAEHTPRVVIGGGTVVATDRDIVYLSLGGTDLPSELVTYACDETNCAFDDTGTIVGGGEYGALGWVGGDKFITAENGGTSTVHVLTRSGQDFERCSNPSANAKNLAVYKFATAAGRTVWSHANASFVAAGAVEALAPAACNAQATELYSGDPGLNTVAVAALGDLVAYTGSDGSGTYRGYVDGVAMLRADNMDFTALAHRAGGLAFRDDGRLLMPGPSGDALWDCGRGEGEDGPYACSPLELYTGENINDAFEVATDANRVVVLSEFPGGYRVTCSDESYLDE